MGRCRASQLIGITIARSQGASLKYTGNTIRKLLKEGRLADAFQAVDIATEQGSFVSTSIAFCLLQRCIDKKDLSVGKKLHGFLERNGFLLNSFIGCHLIRMFSACESLSGAHQVFCSLPEQDVFTWTAIISAHAQLGQGELAITLYYQMQQSNVEADEYLFVAVLRACASIEALSQGKLIHGHIIRMGLELHVYVGSALVDMYTKCGSLEDGQIVLSELPKSSAVPWNAIIGGYAQHRHGHQALILFQKMQKHGTKPNAITFVCVLKACSNMASLEQGELTHAYVAESGFESDVFIGSILIDMYARCGRLADAHRVFEKLLKHDLVTWSAMIAGYVQHGRGEEALHLFKQMLQEGMEPNDAIFVSVLKACSSIPTDHRGNLIHGYVVESGYDSDVCVGSMLIDMLSKYGSLEEAQSVFDNLAQQGVVSWTTMIAGYSQHGHGQEGLRLFERMQQEAQMPNNVTLISALNACSSIAALSQGKLVHARLMASGCDLDVVVGITLINMYTKCGSLESAARVFEKLPNQSLETWTAIIVACAQHSDYKLALHYFESMGQRGLKPDEIIFICLLSACSHAGQVYEGCHLFRSMVEQHSITLRLDHYNSMVNLLGGAGYLMEAEDLLQTMPVLPNVMGWTALLTHCKTYNNVELGGRCFNELVAMDQKDASGYMLLLDTYANVGMVENIDRVTHLRKSLYA